MNIAHPACRTKKKLSQPEENWTFSRQKLILVHAFGKQSALESQGLFCAQPFHSRKISQRALFLCFRSGRHPRSPRSLPRHGRPIKIYTALLAGWKQKAFLREINLDPIFLSLWRWRKLKAFAAATPFCSRTLWRRVLDWDEWWKWTERNWSLSLTLTCGTRGGCDLLPSES